MKSVLKRFVITAGVLATFAGCQMPGPQMVQARQEAQQRWHNARAQMLVAVGQEHLRVGQLSQAHSKATEAIALDSEYIPARFLLAMVCLERGHYALATHELHQLIGIVPNDETAHYLLGAAQEKEGHFEEALLSYRRAQALSENNVAAALGAAEVLITLGRVQEARTTLEPFVLVGSDDPALYELAARLALMENDIGEAVRLYEHAFDLDHHNMRYLADLARAQFREGQYGEAEISLRRLTQSEDFEAPLWVYMMLGDCYMAMGRPHHARDTFNLATRKDPQSAGAWASLAGAALAVGDGPRAVLSARQAMALEPGRLDASLVLGYALLRDGQIEPARQAMDQAAREHPDCATVRVLLGRTYGAAGDSAQAVRHYLDALRLDPDNAAARRLLAAAEGTEISRLP